MLVADICLYLLGGIFMVAKVLSVVATLPPESQYIWIVRDFFVQDHKQWEHVEAVNEG